VRTAALLFLLCAACAGTAPAPPPPAPAAPPPPPVTAPAPPAPLAVAPPDAAPPAPARAAAGIPEARTVEYADMGLRQVDERQWLAETREKLSKKLKVEPAALLFSPDRQRVAALRGPPAAPAARPPRKPRPRRFQIVVAGVDGKRPRVFRPITAPRSDEPPRDLRFLAADRLVYEVVAPPPPPPPPPGSAKARAAARRPPKGPKGKSPPPAPAARPGPPERLFVIQPLGRPSRPVRCRGVRFAFSPAGDHLAHVAGPPEAAYLAVDGRQTYPRRGRTSLATDPVWSKDGHSLAFVEVPAAAAPRLVLVAEYDNPSGDTTWDLPASASSLDGARVFWAGPGKLVVGRSVGKPLFAASFTRD
jgi:hypothetical protein